ncbi:glutathione hydrolase 1 proenzyme-like [Sycon ciliatum]|uniref:glutathione hydrolase 1 proenzyme-like n=1 Tax=Sycon ciliatum TaxID=27933 RepID=UPI0031F71017
MPGVNDHQEDPLVESDDDDDSLRTRLATKGRFSNIKGFRMIVLAMTVFSIAILVSLVITILVGKSPKKDQYAVSSDSATCARVGNDIMKKGGSAVDSAVAILFCLGVVHPHSSGIGGGGFMLVRNGSNTTVFNFRETAPSQARFDMYDGNEILMELGGLAVAVPGEVKGMEHAHRLYGTLKWPDVVQPAINLARHGFPFESSVKRALESMLQVTNGSAEGRAMFKPFRDMLMPDGVVPAVGTNLTRHSLADTLEEIALHGSAALYTGHIAETIVDAVKKARGIMVLDDLKQYNVSVDSPTVTNLTKGWTMYSAPPPASGIIASFIASILTGYGGLSDDALSYHRMVEAFKFAYAQRSYLADPHFNYSSGVKDLIERKLANRTFADEVRRMITDSHTHNVSYYGGEYDVRASSGTTHVSVVRADSAVSVTSTINTYFGALIMTDSGIVLNNEMDDFAAPNVTSFYGLPPAEPNFVEPYKRPLSSQTPTIVCDEKGDVRLVLGASGGTHITTSVFQVFAKVHWQGKSVYDTVLQPRLHDQLIPPYVMAETAMDPAIIAGLQARKHVVNATYRALAVVQAVERTSNGTLRAQADVVRKGGASFVGNVP